MIVQQNLLTTEAHIADALAEHLCNEGLKALVWNLSTSGCWESAVPGSPLPTVKSLLDIVSSIQDWLKSNSTNIAIIACTNGFSKTSIVVGAFKKISNLCDSAGEGLVSFARSCHPPRNLRIEDIEDAPLLEVIFMSIASLVGNVKNVLLLFLIGLVKSCRFAVRVWQIPFASSLNVVRNND